MAANPPIVTRTWTFPNDQLLQPNNWVGLFQYIKQLRDSTAWNVDNTNGQFNAYNQYGTTANMPTPGFPNRQYFATDTNKLYVDNGTTWIAINP